MNEAKNSDGVDAAKAIELAAGPLGEKMGKYPLLFAKVAFFGQRPLRQQRIDINNATVTLVDLDHGPIAITCQHVIEGFREKQKEKNGVIFQLGSVVLDPIEQLIDENKYLDLATIRLTEKQAKTVADDGEIGSCIFKPSSWPPPLINEGEFVAFGGFPGSIRSVQSLNELVFGSWSSGGSKICSVSEFRFVSAFEREYWIKSFGEKNHVDLKALGGMSGGPAFIKRKIHWDLVGVVSEYHENYDAVVFASLKSIRRDGTIELPPV
jgi:hypothetical protein